MQLVCRLAKDYATGVLGDTTCRTVRTVCFYCIRPVVKQQLAIARLWLNASMMSICLSVCLSVCLYVAKMQKNAIFSKTKQFRAMVSIDDL